MAGKAAKAAKKAARAEAARAPAASEATKIILFLSMYNNTSRETEYACPDGSVVSGEQTNDAPVRYLLQKHRGVQEIICIMTRQAQASIWEHFQDVVKKASPKAEITPINYEEDESFHEKAIPAILEHIRQDDRIVLDVTGGFRNANMYLLLLSRVLSYKGIRTVGAVYSNFRTTRVEDISDLIGMFDLVGGMQELDSFGSVKNLRAYYDRKVRQNHSRDEKIDALLTAMERLTETITLCRTSQIDKRLKTFNDALKEAESCEDPLMRTLLPVFEGKYGQRLTTPGLIKWCVENGMIQQALTIYKERIPAYLIRERTDILVVKDGAPPPENAKSYENEDEAWFEECLLHSFGINPPKTTNHDTQYAYFELKCSEDKLRRILNDYRYIRALRNMIHHANDSSTGSQKEMERELFEEDPQYKLLETVGLADVKRALLRSMENMC